MQLANFKNIDENYRNLVRIESVGKNFGGIQALTDVDMDIHEGEIRGLIGPNGAGKTTLFNILSGNYTPSQGRILFDGADIHSVSANQRVYLGIARTFQNIRLFKSLSVLDNVKLGFFSRTKVGWVKAIFARGFCRKEEAWLENEARELLETLELSPYALEPSTSLSYGDQRRLEIARALASRPRLLLLDEPAAGLNEPEVEKLGRLIVHIRNAGITVILVEHDMNLLMSISERVTVLAHGRKIAEGTPSQIQENETVIEEYLGKNHVGIQYSI